MNQDIGLNIMCMTTMCSTSNSGYFIKNKTLFVSIDFDEKLVLEHKMFRDIGKVIFEENQKIGVYSKFRHPIVLTSNIVHLSFRAFFNQPIVLTPNIKYLTLETFFNQPIVLTPNIVYLSFGFCFNQLIVSTPNIKHLTFDHFLTNQLF